MAEVVEDAVFWLPSEFLAEDFTEEEGLTGGCPGNGYSFPSEFPLDWVSPTGSNSSGFDSFLTEAESEEDGLWLTAQGSVPFHRYAVEDGKELACSPQSTLWEGPVSEVESPLSPLKSRQSSESDPVCEAASKVARILVDGRGEQNKMQQQQSSSPSPSGAVVSANKFAGWSSPVPGPAHQKLQVNSWQKQRSAWGKNGKAIVNEGPGNGGGGELLGLPSSAWPPLKQPQKPESPPQAATSAVFPGGPAAAAPRESYGGTGVFLPRNNHLNNRPHIRRKKSACTPVLLPARVVEALKLDLDENGSIRRMPNAIILENDDIVAQNMTLLHRRGFFPRSTATSAADQVPARLPQEWTY